MQSMILLLQEARHIDSFELLDTLTADAEGIFVRVDFNEIQQSMRERRRKSNP